MSGEDPVGSSGGGADTNGVGGSKVKGKLQKKDRHGRWQVRNPSARDPHHHQSHLCIFPRPCPSIFSQERWFEYRAPYLMYWKHQPVPGSDEDGAPDAAIDLRRTRWVSPSAPTTTLFDPPDLNVFLCYWTGAST
jgi:hypothetical protein